MDASFVKVPVQRNTRAEKQQIKNDEIPPSFKENENKMRQKDTDAEKQLESNRRKVKDPGESGAYICMVSQLHE